MADDGYEVIGPVYSVPPLASPMPTMVPPSPLAVTPKVKKDEDSGSSAAETTRAGKHRKRTNASEYEVVGFLMILAFFSDLAFLVEKILKRIV